MNRRRFLGAAALAAGWERMRGLAQSVGRLTASERSALAARLSQDPLRPQFHLLPAANWMNDPCAPRFFAGQYHMFFQYNPGAAVWGDMHWAHATSPDMVHWRHKPVALAPTPAGADAAGCFTGSVFPGAEKPTILYTGVTRVTSAAEETIPHEKLREAQCMATADSSALDRWTKVEEPVLPTPPGGLRVTGFRDPCPWREGDVWYMGVGSGFRGKGGAVLLYRSEDGSAWEYLHPLAEGKWNGGAHSDPVDNGEMWECPDFFTLGDRQVLLYSTERKVYWQTGRLDPTTLRFRMRQQGMLDLGSFYAPKSMLDARGRRILWGWIPETRPVAEYRAAGWAGMMSLPRLLTIAADGRLLMEPIGEMAQLMRAATQETGSPLTTEEKSSEPKSGEQGTWSLPRRQGRVRVELRSGPGAMSLRLGAASDDTGAEPMLRIEYDGGAEARVLRVGDKRLGLHPNRNGVSVVDVWLDASVAEIFADRSSVTTERLYAAPGETLRMTWTGAPGVITRVETNEVRPISRDRLTT